MARKDWWYPHLPIEQADALDYIIERIGGKLGVSDRQKLVRKIVAEFIQKYEETYGPVETRRAVRAPNGKDVAQTEF